MPEPRSLRPDEIARALETILPWVEKPARYTGAEWNSIVKDWGTTALRVALVFPDVYEIGMSNLGLAVLYDIVNTRPDMLAERVFAPWTDMEEDMRREGIPLFSLETRHALGDFDIVGFSLPYEQLYTNALNMLDLAGIPLRSSDRRPGDPLVIAGGCATFNPEPVHAFFDAFVVGDGEDAILDVANAYRVWRDSSLSLAQVAEAGSKPAESSTAVRPRLALLRSLAAIPGVYVPSFYGVSYNQDGTVDDVQPVEPDAPLPVVKRIVSQLPPPLARPIVPYLDIVHNRVAMEIQRGCSRGCRFCQAGMVYRPVRERPLAEVVKATSEVIEQTGFEEVAFLALSASDYEGITELVQQVIVSLDDPALTISLPSLRMESFSVSLLEGLSRGRRKGGFTFAPEAATDRLRQAINKPIATDTLLEVAEEVFTRGWTSIKLYFMIGHPTQTEEDVAAIVHLVRQVREIGRGHCGNRATVRVSVATFVPKPHTPFQWQSLASAETIAAQIDLLRRGLRGRGLELSWNDPRESLIEAALSRGDRRLADVVWRAHELGARFDAWQDQLNVAAWQQAFAEQGLDPDWYARRERSLDERLPWSHISTGVSPTFLAAEHERALRAEITADCRQTCSACGVMKAFGRQRGQADWKCPARGNDAATAHDEGRAALDDGSRAMHELPDGAVAQRAERRAMTPVQRLRLTFRQGDAVKYVAHLDMMRLWERAMRRAKVRLAYTQGFHPQPRLQIAAPLAVGFCGVRELLDVWLADRLDPAELGERLSACLPAGMDISDVREVYTDAPSLPSQVVAATYSVEVAAQEPETEMAALVNRLMEASAIWRERRRKGELRRYDLRPLIQELRYDGRTDSDGWHRLWMRLRLEGGATGRPDEVLAALGLEHRARHIERLELLFER